MYYTCWATRRIMLCFLSSRAGGRERKESGTPSSGLVNYLLKMSVSPTFVIFSELISRHLWILSEKIHRSKYVYLKRSSTLGLREWKKSFQSEVSESGKNAGKEKKREGKIIEHALTRGEIVLKRKTKIRGLYAASSSMVLKIPAIFFPIYVSSLNSAFHWTI